MYNDAPMGHVIGDVNATDGDCCQFGLIQYAIINDPTNYFAIDPSTVRDISLRMIIGALLIDILRNIQFAGFHDY